MKGKTLLPPLVSNLEVVENSMN